MREHVLTVFQGPYFQWENLHVDLKDYLSVVAMATLPLVFPITKAASQ